MLTFLPLVQFPNKFLFLLFSVFLFSLRAHSEAPIFKVLAWNVGQTLYSGKLQDELSSNLEAIMKGAHSPEMLVLVEANEETEKAIKRASPEKYGYRVGEAIPYSADFPWAFFIVLWKDSEIEFEAKKQIPINPDLDFSHLSQEEKKYSNEMRSFVSDRLKTIEFSSLNQINFKFNGKPFTLYPVHFSNVWPFAQQFFYPKAREGARHWMLPSFVEEKNASFTAKACVLKELIVGKLNPHAALVDQYLEKLKELHSKEKGDASILIVGDFNAFPRIERFYGMGARAIFHTDKAHACAEFEKYFTPVYAPKGSVSFPTDSYLEAEPGTDFRLLIDLAYFRGPLWRAATAKVLPLAGSDHYPVFYEFLYQP